MTSIMMEKEFAEELVDLKLHYLYEEVQKLLSAWNYQSATQFLSDAKDGTIREAEEDAINLEQLIADREKLLALKSSWSE
jgi:hypothetical protein